MPPSPRLSACRVSRMYLKVVWMVSVQNTQLMRAEDQLLA